MYTSGTPTLHILLGVGHDPGHRRPIPVSKPSFPEIHTLDTNFSSSKEVVFQTKGKVNKIPFPRGFVPWWMEFIHRILTYLLPEKT